MRLTNVFQKPVDRPIEGVIKADDQAGLATEVEEYVLTNEIEKRLEAFLSAYNDYQGANGVWISGFFGSGKSHLLKMLAYLLESGADDSFHIVESFLKKCGDNKLLRAEITRAVSIPSKSILFNIDQKADVISKRNVDALLAVFLKVFNEMQGYFGKQGYIAQFERELDEREIYDQFQAEYERIAGISWDRGREQSLLEGENIANAYAAVTGSTPSSAVGILDRYRDTYAVSIEDFAEMVNQYIQRHGPNFRLNFFVDEVGQYIADNVKLMTNLQTIAESLATKCRGRAWVIVTAQEDMNTVVGEMDAQQGNDFSKIQARFKTRMKLTSQDVAEVIQKRLLAKNDTGTAQLTHVYQQQVNNFKTLFDFADGAQTYRNYRDQDHFVNAYPFIPYQFVLFQSAIQSLSQHNAFEGKHSSVGERSMLGVFQQVAMQIGNHELGQIVTFDLMFEGIRSSLKANIQRSILNAENNLDHPFAIRLLKALFLVKYVKEFKATERNLAVLMTERFGQDMSKLRRQVEEALNILEQQTYIQRNSGVYEYLTDEEKDVEQEIKNTEIESSSVVDELGTIIFDRIIRETKIRAEEGAFDYAFSRSIDNRPFKRTGYELAIHLITPFNEHTTNLPVLLAQSMGRDELFIIMPPDDRLVRELTLYIQTHKYFNQNINMAQNERIKMILTNKQYQNVDRYREIEQHVRTLLGDATFVVNGAMLDVNGGDAQTRIIRGFHHLIRSTYTHLKMLPNTAYRDTDVSLYLSQTGGLFDATDLSEAEREVLNVIVLQKSNGMRITVKGLTDTFERKPYGWYLAAIQCTLAKLHARGRVEIRQDGNILEGDELAQALTNTRAHPNLVLTPEEEFTSSQVRVLKDFYNEFFDKPPKAEEAKDLANETKSELQQHYEKLRILANDSHNYSFLTVLTPVLNQLREAIGKPYAWYLTDFGADADELLDAKDNIISPVLSFMNGAQRTIYDEARDFLKLEEANFQSTGYDDALQIKQTLDDPHCFRGDHMRRVKSLMDGLRGQIVDALTQSKDAAMQDLIGLYERLTNDERFQRLPKLNQQHIIESFQDIEKRIQEQHRIIAVVNEETRRFREDTFSQLLIQMDEWLHESDPQPGGGPAPRAEYIKRSAIPVPFSKLSLDSEDDVEAYVQALYAAYLQQIQAGKRIQL